MQDFAFKLREYEFCYGNLEISVFFSVHAFFHLPTNNKAFHDQLQIKEFELMRDERDKLLRECEALRSKLTSVKDELELAKTKSASWQNDPEILWNGTSVIATGVTLQQNRNQCGLEDTFVMHKRLAQATVDLEALREENRDALIQIQKLNAQLDASKQAFYEVGDFYFTPSFCTHCTVFSVIFSPMNNSGNYKYINCFVRRRFTNKMNQGRNSN